MMLAVHPGERLCETPAQIEILRNSNVNPATLSALSALAGSDIGALASVATTWLTRFFEKPMSDPDGARLVVQSSQSSTVFAKAIRNNLKADVAEAIVQGHVTVRNAELAVDIVIGIWLQVTHGILEQAARPELTSQAVGTVRACLA